MVERKLFTSESVTEGHPDKICDQVSDAILDEFLKQDKNARVACETVASKNLLLITGEITANANVDIEQVARKTITEIGYTSDEIGLDGHNCEVIIKINQQSNDIAQGVDITDNIYNNENDNVGAGDQGLMFGFATNETEEYMPLPIYLAHKLSRKLAEVRHDGTITYLRPDGKTQVTVEYDENNKPIGIDTVLLSTQHDDFIQHSQIAKDITTHVFNEVLPKYLINENTRFLVNPTGRFVQGGSSADVGLTGRKIIVDTYGGYARHGGGAFSGKDATKVDRSGAYMCRYIAKNLVASGYADKLEVQVSYAIGVAEPTSIMVDTFGTGKLSESEIVKIIRETFDLRPQGIIKTLDLKKPQYKQTASYGHFGRNDIDVAWERLDKVEELKQKLK